MGLINEQHLTITPAGVSDSLDGTNAFSGAMTALTDLVQAPGSQGIFVPRPASTKLTDFSGFESPGQITAAEVINGRVYGMIATGRFAGKEEPFVFDLADSAFLTVQNVTAQNTPQALGTSGDWVPPVVAPVAASRIVVTHTGFQGKPTGAYFGWFDISGFSVTLKGNVTSGSNVIASINDGSTSAPILDGVQPGQLVSGPGIVAGTYVVAVANGTFSLNTTGNTNSTPVVTGLASTAGVQPGMSVSGPQFAAGSYVRSVDSGTQVTLNTAALGTAAGTAVDFSGGGSVALSAEATDNATLANITFSGGTEDSPLWCAGNTNTNPLPGVPVSVVQFNGRAYYAVGNTLALSDSLNPTQISLASQFIVLDGKEPVTALSGQPLSSQVTGGIVQAILAFKGADIVYQITGDPATNDLKSQAVNGSVGTLAPGTLCATPAGTAYVAPDGVRFIGLGATSSPPDGLHGAGVAVPFIQTFTPSRMTAAYNQNIYRVAFQEAPSNTLLVREYWLDLTTMRWTGPHTFPASVISPVNLSSMVGFVLASPTIPGTLWFSSAIPSLQSTYIENGVPMTWAYQTILLPDNEVEAMNTCMEALQMIALPYYSPVVWTVYDENGQILDQITKQIPVNPSLWGQAIWGIGRWQPAKPSSVWGGFTWGAANWGTQVSKIKQHKLNWSQPLVFKQAYVTVTGQSSAGVAIGNLYVKYRTLGYAGYEDN